MLRTMIENDGKLVLGGFKTAGEYHTGMGVTKNESTGVATVPTAETGTGIFVLNKERIPTGVNAARTEFSDYDTEFNTFTDGEQCLLVPYGANEKFAVDQYDATNCVAANIGKYAAVGTDGKWTIAAAATSSQYVFLGLHNDAGHTLAMFEVVGTEGKNS